MKKLVLSLFVLMIVVSSVFAQDRTITGTVTDKEMGKPLPGVTVRIRGAQGATQTQANGTYSIVVPAGATSLEFAYLGFVTATRPLTSASSTINVVLEGDATGLNEVVVTGYGSGRALGSIVGSVATVSARVVENKPVANAFDALQGKVSGLQVFTSSGEPSAASSIRLHGVGSLGASNTPLYLLDGIQVDAGSIVSLNPNDIESISVLKDASSTSIYGSRAANGVIYVTTKKGKIGSSSISVQSQYTVNNVAQQDFYRSVMNSAELAAFQVKTGLRTQASADALLTNFPNDTKWFDYYHKKDVPTYQTDITFSGGAGKTSYYISGSYYQQEGIRYRSNFDRYTFRSNLNTQLNDYISLGLNLSGGTDNRQLNNQGSNSTNGGLSLLAQPWFTPFDPAGNEYYGVLIPGWGRYSPNYLADNQINNGNNLQFNPSGFIQVQPFKGLTFKSQGGMDGYVYRTTSGVLPSFAGALGNGSKAEDYARQITKTWTNTLEYLFSIKQHNITALAGQEYVDGTYQDFSASTVGLANDNLYLLQNGTPTNRGVASGKSEYAYKSIFGRLDYNYQSRYYLDLSIREDKSSRFGANKQAATFWSVGAMWRMKEESFLKNVKWLDDLTLRASTGTSGNSSIGNYESLATASSINPTYNGLTGLLNNASGNPELGWERQQKTTVLINSSFFNRIRLAVELYRRTTSDQLISVPQVFTTGFANIRQNIGAIQNTGIDVTLDFDAYENKSRNAYITPYVNVNYNKNEITELFQGKQYYIIPNTGVLWAIGQPVSYAYPMWAGVNPANGLPQWYVPNSGDGIINTRNDPNAITNSFNANGLNQNTGIQRYPWLNGGFGFNAGYEGFYTSVDFTFSKGKFMINNDRYFFENPNQFAGFNQAKNVQDYWTAPGQVTRYPAYSQQFTQFDDRLIEDASFIRLKGLQVGYNVPESILSRTKVVKGVKLFVMARNLLTFTDYTGPDPEADTNVSLGVNPNTQQIGLGLQVRF